VVQRQQRQNLMRLHLYKIRKTPWHMPFNPATREAIDRRIIVQESLQVKNKISKKVT
jgi:hypothetical protein